MRTLARIALTVGTLAVLGYFVAAISADTEIVASDEPGTPGKFDIYTALTFALILGWALGAGVEAAWDDEKQGSDWWEPYVFATFPRLLIGIVLFFVIQGFGFGFEALGVGLGGQ